MPIRFLKNASEIADVSPATPLPVLETSRERKMVMVEPILIQTLTVDTTVKDLLNNTATDVATIGNAGVYRTLIWTGFKQGATDINYTVQARTTDPDGNPFGTGWITLVSSGTITGAANTWFRIVISQTDGLYYDQYRITVSQSSGTQTTHHKIVGVRG